MRTDLKAIPRTAVDSYLRVLRLPVHAAETVLHRNGDAPWAPAIAFDKVDAAVRGAIGQVLRDEDLIAEAQRRRIAADKRSQALRLHTEAEAKRRHGDQTRAQQEAAAEEQRAEARARAEEQEDQLAAKREQAERQVEKAAEDRRKAAEKADRARAEAARKRELADRSEVLEDKSAALDTEEKAVQATKKARTTKKAEKAVKAARKRSA
jgi:hypothetical protein